MTENSENKIDVEVKNNLETSNTNDNYSVINIWTEPDGSEKWDVIQTKPTSYEKALKIAHKASKTWENNCPAEYNKLPHREVPIKHETLQKMTIEQEIVDNQEYIRELKFRAWNKSQNYMAYQGDVDLETLSSFMFHFGDDILMQYTGLNDFLNNKIFEGDILSAISSDGYTYLVKFDNGEFCLYSKFGRWGPISKLHPTCNALNIEVNVIGNIYENPEMWKDGV